AGDVSDARTRIFRNSGKETAQTRPSPRRGTRARDREVTRAAGRPGLGPGPAPRASPGPLVRARRARLQLPRTAGAQGESPPAAEAARPRPPATPGRRRRGPRGEVPRGGAGAPRRREDRGSEVGHVSDRGPGGPAPGWLSRRRLERA